MTKRQIIDDILLLNRSAKPAFLARFDSEELDAYLRHLQLAQTPRLSCMEGQYAKYFQNVPAIGATEPPREETSPEPAPADDWLPLADAEPMLFGDDLQDRTPAVAASRTHSPGGQPDQ
jgi:hypothetical protein